MFPEKKLYHIVPGLPQGFVHGKNVAGNPGGAYKLLVLVFQVQVHAGNLLRRKTAVYGGNSAFLVLTGELEHKVEGGGRPFSLDNVKADRAHKGERHIAFRGD